MYDEMPIVIPDQENINLAILSPGLPKSLQFFYFFQITDVNHFRQAVRKFVVPNIATAHQITTTNLPPSGTPKPDVEFLGFSVGFSSAGLIKLGLTDSLRDESFDRGQLADAKSLGDSGVERGGNFNPDWDAQFKGAIHGIFQISAHSEGRAVAFMKKIDEEFSTGKRASSITKIILLRAEFRPDSHAQHEHFGYRHGISNPEVEDVTFTGDKPMRFPGSPVVDMGLIVMGYDGDEDKSNRPAWAVDGSFLVFRKLKCLVPEFDEFLLKEGSRMFPNIDRQRAADRLGSRLFGRWKNGGVVPSSSFSTPSADAVFVLFLSRDAGRSLV